MEPNTAVDPLADTVLTDNSTVRMRRETVRALAAQTLSMPRPDLSNERLDADNGTRKVWHSRAWTWLRQYLPLASQSCVDRALNRKGKEAYRGVIAARERELRAAIEAGERELQTVVAAARESHATATFDRNTSHAFVFQRLIGDAQRLGTLVNEKLRTGRLKHTESTLVDESWFVDDFIEYLKF